MREARCAGVVHTPVVRIAQYGQRDSRGAWFKCRPVVLGVIPDGRAPDRTPVVPVWFRAGVVRSCGWHPEATARAAEPAVPADRCARKIVVFLCDLVRRSRQLNGNPFGVRGAWEAILFSM